MFFGLHVCCAAAAAACSVTCFPLTRCSWRLPRSVLLSYAFHYFRGQHWVANSSSIGILGDEASISYVVSRKCLTMRVCRQWLGVSTRGFPTPQVILVHLGKYGPCQRKFIFETSGLEGTHSSPQRDPSTCNSEFWQCWV